jgi:hypothetical protein
LGPSKTSRWRRWGFLVLSAINSGLGSSPAAAASPGPGSTPEATTPAPPIIITAGGTYTGSWQSLDPNVPAVRVFTPAPVIIENCTVSSVTDGISTGIGSNVTIRNCRGYALNPNVAGTPKGSFALGYNFASLIVEHNLIEGFRFGGIAINGPPEALETFSGQIVTLANRWTEVIKQVDGHSTVSLNRGKRVVVHPVVMPQGIGHGRHVVVWRDGHGRRRFHRLFSRHPHLPSGDHDPDHHPSRHR